MAEAVIFDMDGVLIDSQPLHYQVDVAVLKQCGYPATLETVIPYTGQSNPDRWPKYRAQLGLVPETEELIALQTAILMETFEKEPLTAIAGIPALLRWLKDRGVKTAVASSSSHDLIDLVLRKLDIAAYFDTLVSGEDVRAGKPAPDVFLYSAEKLGSPPGRCVVVEDSPSGILAAKNAGMLCVAYRNPTTQGQDFTLADYVVDEYVACYGIFTSLFERMENL
jgi:HAD superfamily hydrolase (TIGR01509 family)